MTEEILDYNTAKCALQQNIQAYNNETLAINRTAVLLCDSGYEVLARLIANDGVLNDSLQITVRTNKNKKL